MNDRLIALVDMDCFYCQVETRLDPFLKGKPMAVVQYNQWKGGGIIAVNYEARDRGVTRHMRGDEAKKHCPEIQLVSVPAVRGKADLTKYRDAGREVIKVICEFSECVQRASVDEAYIDLTEAVDKQLALKVKVTPAQLENTFVVGFSPDDSNDEEVRSDGVTAWLEQVYSSELLDPGLHRLATATALVEEMRAAIYDRTGFRCSAGVAHNKILAKLVCGLHKPNRQTVLPFASVPKLYSNLPLKKVRSLGGKFGDDVVEKLGITCMSELANFTEKQLQDRFDDKNGTWLYNIARGIDSEPVTTRLISKSIGCCKKFPGKTSLRTSTNVTHWLSELATEVAERLDEDIHMNKRKAQLLTIHFSQETNGKDVAMSRSVAFPGYEAERIAGCAFSVLSKHNSAPHPQDAWHPPLKYLGLSAGKFTEYSGNSNGSIDKFFKAKSSSSTSKSSAGDTCDINFTEADDSSTKNSNEDSKKHSYSENDNCCSKVENKKETLVKTNGKISFFEKYFMNQPNKIIKNSPIKQNIYGQDSRESNFSVQKSTENKMSNVDSARIDAVDSTVSNGTRVEEDSSCQVRINEESEGNEDPWISPSEIFPDLEDIDDSVIDILPSPMQRRIYKLKEDKQNPSAGCKTKGTEIVSSYLRLSTESDCAPTRVETVVDVHAPSRSDNFASSLYKCSVRNRELKSVREDENTIESENVFDRTSLDLFEPEPSENSENDRDRKEVFEKCCYCGEEVPLCGLQEHLDHHVAMELHEQMNKQSENNRKISNVIKTNKSVSVVSDKKKRGRPSKKDSVAPKKLRTIVSFFTKS